jgi:two-component system chemotaxis response regulator CheB
LIVDDSALVRSVLKTGFEKDPELEVVGQACDPYEARDLLVKLRPDVMTLDVEMPRMDGVTFLRKFMAVLPTPTIVLSSLTTHSSKLAFEAIQAGAVDVVAKPASGLQTNLDSMMGDLIRRVKGARGARVVARAEEPEQVEVPSVDIARISETTDRVIGLGASTGGVAALGRILPVFPAWTPGIVIVQHMAAGFTREFAQRLDGLCKMRVVEAKDGDRVLRGHIFVAPGGNQHLEVRRFGGEYRIRLVEGPLVSGHIPSVDVFFESLAKHAMGNAAACLMTGMGADGAQGLLRLRLQGGRTFAQNRETSVVWGMPAAAQALGAADRMVPLENIPAALIDWATKKVE